MIPINRRIWENLVSLLNTAVPKSLNYIIYKTFTACYQFSQKKPFLNNLCPPPSPHLNSGKLLVILILQVVLMLPYKYEHRTQATVLKVFPTSRADVYQGEMRIHKIIGK